MLISRQLTFCPQKSDENRKNIASFLGVGDIYQNIYHELTYYGDESDTLEFKSSAPVFVIGTPKFQDWVAISIKS